ncbi:hypothetical protein ACWEQ2_03940 [Streptomyces sp. NPDC004096]|uniref:hypothetical protein n=1 Tax=unclassified Streptomyces TaxID=2593676 RepID=UPI0033B0AACA
MTTGSARQRPTAPTRPGPRATSTVALPPAGTLTSPDPRTTSVSRQSWKTLTRNLPVRPFGFLTATVAVEVDDE